MMMPGYQTPFRICIRNTSHTAPYWCWGILNLMDQLASDTTRLDINLVTMYENNRFANNLVLFPRQLIENLRNVRLPYRHAPAV